MTYKAVIKNNPYIDFILFSFSIPLQSFKKNAGIAANNHRFIVLRNKDHEKNKMSKLHFTTKHANEATVQRNWYVVDGTNQTVGRMCAKIASVLRGKNKPYYTPHVDCGDFVVVTNCDKVKFTGKKLDDKIYINYSGYPGGQKQETAGDFLKRRPDAVIERAIKGMLPKNRLGRKMYKKLYVYAGTEHPHTAQKPQTLTF